MNQMKRRNFLRVGLGSAAVLVAPKTFAAEKALDLSSKQVAALFSEFAQTKKNCRLSSKLGWMIRSSKRSLLTKSLTMCGTLDCAG